MTKPVLGAAVCARLPAAGLNPIASQASSAVQRTIPSTTQTRPSSTSTTRVPTAHSALQASPSRPQHSIITKCTGMTQATPVRSNSTAAREEAAKLDWNSFFQLRASRRRYTLASSIVTSAGSTVTGLQALSTQNLEGLGAQVMGLDPFVVLGLSTAACGAAGWLVGPFVGNAVWGLVNGSYKKAFLLVCTLEVPRNGKRYLLILCRKRKSSLTESSDIALTLRPTPLRTPFLTTMARRLAASRAIDSGSRTSGPTTARGATSLLKRLVAPSKPIIASILPLLVSAWFPMSDSSPLYTTYVPF